MKTHRHRASAWIMIEATLIAPWPALSHGMARDSQSECEPRWSDRFTEAGVVGKVTELLEFDHGGDRSLAVAGLFVSAGGLATSNMARYDGTSWAPMGAGLGTAVNDLEFFDFGGGARLTAAGMPGLIPGAALAQWSGSTWVPGPPGLPQGWLGNLSAFKGQLLASGPVSVPNSPYMVRWNGSQWTGMTPQLGSVLWDDLVLRDSDGKDARIVVTGVPLVEGVPNTIGIAAWDGTTWSALGTGVNGLGRALVKFDDGGGEALYVGGMFTTAGGGQALRVARWKDGVWSAVGAGFSHEVLALCVFDDGSGPALYAGGKFTSSGSTPIARLARWSGASWQEVGGGVAGGDVHVLRVFDDDGDGATPPALYVGGDFTHAGGVPSRGVARWGCVLPCVADFDQSGSVDGGDLGELLGQWGSAGCGEIEPCTGDFNGDGRVDGSDLGSLLGAWGSCAR